MLSSAPASSLLSDRFWQNFLPIPATNQFRLGTPAPPFELLQVQTGQSVRLLDYRSDSSGNSNAEQQQQTRLVLLAFTRIFTERHYCPLCYPHIKELNDTYEQFTRRGIEILMITSTDLYQSQIVAQDFNLQMPLLSDPRCRVFRQYQTGQALGAPLPAQFICDRAGKIRFRHLFSFIEPNAGIDRLLAACESID